MQHMGREMMYLFRQITRLGVDGSAAVGEINFVAGAVCSAALECPLCPSSVPGSATEALVAFFRAISDLRVFN